MPLPHFKFINNTRDAESHLVSLTDARLIALDTETYYESSLKRMRLSLIQIAHAQDPVIILDALAFDFVPARAMIESPLVQMAAHNARFDEGVLIDAGLKPENFIDTLRLARKTLHLPSYRLTDVATELFGGRYDKSLQKSNWRKRPLTHEQLAYAAQDAVLTLRIYNELQRRLQLAGKWDEAARSARLEPRAANERKPRKPRAVRLQLAPLSLEEKISLMH